MSKKTDIMAALSPIVASVEKTIKIGDISIQINIKPLITPKMRVAIVNNVCDRIYNENGRNYGLVDFAFRSAVVKVCTDLKVTLDDGSEAALLYGTDLYDTVRGVIGFSIIGELEDACYKQIKAAIQTELVLMQAMTQSNPFDRIADEIQGLIHNINNAVTNIDPETARDLLNNKIDEQTLNNIVYGSFGKEDEDGPANTDEQAHLSGTDEVDQSGEHPTEE